MISPYNMRFHGREVQRNRSIEKGPSASLSPGPVERCTENFPRLHLAQYPTAGGMSNGQKNAPQAASFPGVCFGLQGRKSVEQSHEAYTLLTCTLLVKLV